MYLDAEKRLKKILQKNPKAQKEWNNSFKLKDDPRVTPIGRFLRRTSIDEFPQIFNILRGEMSLVGPRPVVREEIEKYYGTFKQYYYSVYPGLAGLWQVSGRSDTDYQFRVQTDVWYVQNWSLWLDIIILFKAVAVVLKKEGAY
jgi:undecaprenyl-phosphate galactose phosphotransferase